MAISIVSALARGVSSPRRSREVLSEDKLGTRLDECSSKLDVDGDGKIVRTRLDQYTGYFLNGLSFDDPDEDVQARLQGLDVGLHQMLDIKAQNLNGSFVGAQVSKLGGRDNLTTVYISMGPTPAGDLIVYEMSFDKARTLGLEKRENPFGVTLMVGKKRVQTLILGVDTPLNFVQRLQVFVHIAERDVSKVEATVLWGVNEGGGGDLGTSGGGDDEFP